MHENRPQPRFRTALFSAVLLLVAASLASAAEPVRIMMLGDSITAGYTDNSTWNVPYGFGADSGLYTRLNAANYPFQFVGGSQEPFNGVFGVPKTVSSPDLRLVDQAYMRGYGGWTAAQLNAYAPWWLNSDNPDVICLMIGINSIGQGSSGNPTAAENDLNTLVTTIFNARPNVSLIVAQITPYAASTPALVTYNNYIKNTLVPSFATQGRKIATVDQYSNFLTGGSIDTSLYSNGINHPNATGYDRMAQTWFNGIQALGAIATPPAAAKPLLANGGFETQYMTSNSHNINPAGTGWTFTTGSTGAGSGIDQGNPYGAGTNVPATGAQMGFLQGAGNNSTSQITQTLQGLTVGKAYSLSFQATGISGFTGTNPFHVSLAGADLNFGGSTLINPAVSSTYTAYSTTFTATSATMSLRFYDAGNVVGSRVSFIDNVKLGIVTAADKNLVTNGSFDNVAFGTNSHTVNPANTGWRFQPSAISGAGSGVENGNPYGTSTPNSAAFNGSQMAFLQGLGAGNGTSSIEQDVSNFQIGGLYQLTFESAAIEGFTGVNPFTVMIGGTPVTFSGRTSVSPSASYGLYVSDPFVASSSTMTLRFADAGNVPYTQVSWIDDVQITAVPEPSTLVALLTAAAFGLAGVIWQRRR